MIPSSNARAAASPIFPLRRPWFCPADVCRQQALTESGALPGENLSMMDQQANATGQAIGPSKLGSGASRMPCGKHCCSSAGHRRETVRDPSSGESGGGLPSTMGAGLCSRQGPGAIEYSLVIDLLCLVAHRDTSCAVFKSPRLRPLWASSSNSGAGSHHGPSDSCSRWISAAIFSKPIWSAQYIGPPVLAGKP